MQRIYITDLNFFVSKKVFFRKVVCETGVTECAQYLLIKKLDKETPRGGE